MHIIYTYSQGSIYCGLGVQGVGWLGRNFLQMTPKLLPKTYISFSFEFLSNGWTLFMQIDSCTHSKTLPSMAVDVSPLVLSFCLQAEKGRRGG